MLSRKIGAATFTGSLAALFLSDTTFALDPVLALTLHAVQGCH